MTAKKLIPIFVLLLFGLTPLAHSAEPMVTLQGHIDQFIGLLENPQYQGPSQKELLREKIWEVVRKLFDLEGLGRRTLGRNWKKFTPEERKEFTDVFSELLGTVYIDRIPAEYKDEKVAYLAQEMVTDRKALVKTKILRQGADIPVSYSMWLRKGAWRVYDVKIEGVSLVKNYRAQFKEILLNKPPSSLIERIKKKVERQKMERAGKK